MFKPTSRAGKMLVSEIHNADKLERVTNAIEFIEASKRNDMNDKDIITFVDTYCKDELQAAIIQGIIIFEETFNFLIDNEVE